MHYQEGDSVYISLIHQTYTLSTNKWAEADPDAGFPTVTIIDPLGTTKVDAQAMVKQATGKFDYSYTVPASPELGWWRGYIDVENGTYPDRKHFSFKVGE